LGNRDAPDGSIEAPGRVARGRRMERKVFARLPMVERDASPMNNLLISFELIEPNQNESMQRVTVPPGSTSRPRWPTVCCVSGNAGRN